MSEATTADLAPLRRLAKAPEIAEATGIRLHRLYELCRKDEVPHVAIGRSYRFDPEAVAEWLRAGGTSGNGSG